MSVSASSRLRVAHPSRHPKSPVERPQPLSKRLRTFYGLTGANRAENRLQAFSVRLDKLIRARGWLIATRCVHPLYRRMGYSVLWGFIVSPTMRLWRINRTPRDSKTKSVMHNRMCIVYTATAIYTIITCSELRSETLQICFLIGCKSHEF